MLRNLHIENIAVIDRLDMEFGDGFAVLTGETGAGKSILIDSINMLLGERTSKTLLRYGCQKALVQGLFTVENPDARKRLERQGVPLEEDGTLLLQRELHQDGRNVCRAGQAIVTVSAMKAIGSVLVNIHGQHDSQALLDPTAHITFLDRFARDRIRPLLTEYVGWYNKVAQTRRKLAALQMDDAEKKRRLDVLEFELSEIGAAELKSGEEEALERKRDRINHSQRLLDALQSAYDALHGEEGSAYDLIAAARQSLRSIADLDEQYQAAADLLDGVSAGLEECTHDVRTQLEEISFDGDDINAVEARLDVIYTLKRKYGGSVDAVLAHYEAIQAEHEAISTSGAQAQQLASRLSELTHELRRVAGALHQERETAAAALETSIKSELEYLDMPNVHFQVSFEPVRFNPHGADRVEFLISTNAGQPLRPLSKIVSGGELSRIMLAMKSILADSDMVETFIFDEIDTGVSGRAAQRIGNRIASLSDKKQILCITHLASIAALADRHYHIEKQTEGDETYTTVTELDQEARAAELARIIGGDRVTETTLAQARQMMERGD